MNTEEKKQDKPDLLKQMASVVGHEIRNPLAIISNSVYFIKSKLSAGGAALDPKLAKHLGIIESEVRHGNEIIEEILLFTRPKEVNRAAASLNAVVKDLAAYYQFPPSVTVKTVPDPSDPRVDLDADAMARAARYVFDNAVQAMPEGGTVTIEVSHGDKCGRIAVTDSGPGLPDGDGEKLFTPFFTTKPRGVGLGLTIARKFIEQLGGSATAENAAGKGVKITLSLPLLP
ncbi:MAG TPA: hypothetical protein DCZ92_13390 [Elusimicrobia bacterium]|nr:MAG: hypothetical protein A2016_08405 [Elusimicrobia bacterium GWF2_62_30]HBA61776.1 hypothetical protein [Elusimicrobiota bacterium]